MAKTVVGVFSSEKQAESAVNEMRNSGFTEEEISIVAKDDRKKGKDREREGTMMGIGDMAGVTTGGVLGGRPISTRSRSTNYTMV